MEVFEIIDNICMKNNIRYFADCGTLLGAIRHKGFIPWDDDMDIALLRDEYKKLVEILPDELPEGFVMAGMYSSDSRLNGACECSQTRVIADEEYWSLPDYMNRFHCFPYPRIGIDIFPLDYIPDDEDDRKEFFYTVKDLFALCTKFDEQSDNIEYKKKLEEYSKKYDINTESANLKHDLWILTDKVCSKYKSYECSEVVNLFDYTVYHRGIYKKKWYEEVERCPYENTDVPVPKHYDEVLKSCYGDYLIPQKFVAAHDYPFYATQEEALKEMFLKAGITTDVEEFCNNWEKAMKSLKSK